MGFQPNFGRSSEKERDRRLYFIPGEDRSSCRINIRPAPSDDDGHIMMGEALARKLGPIINGSTERPE